MTEQIISYKCPIQNQAIRSSYLYSSPSIEALVKIKDSKPADIICSNYMGKGDCSIKNEEYLDLAEEIKSAYNKKDSSGFSYDDKRNEAIKALGIKRAGLFGSSLFGSKMFLGNQEISGVDLEKKIDEQMEKMKADELNKIKISAKCILSEGFKELK